MDRRERPRRLRRDDVRELAREIRLDPADLIAPVFVDATASEPVGVPSMPGYARHPVDDVAQHVADLRSDGARAVILFGIPETKDATGSRADADDGVIQRGLRSIDDRVDDDLAVITDVCLCEYTNHGHCGLLEDGAQEAAVLTVDNDPSIDRLATTAVSHADAGADLVAPSASLDGMVGAIRAGLDDAGHRSVPIMSYSVKYHSAFYGPFREAAEGAPTFGDRRHYQQDPANRREARREARLDVEEGADIVMVKPALPYLDVISDVREGVDVPVAAYNVSGEYAMLAAAAERGWLDLEATALEALTAIKRAGASPVVTYFAPQLLRDELV
ncbi:MAG: porphobilinogen synthase [Halobacteriales archaeon]